MPDAHDLKSLYPALASALPRMPLADLPTPLGEIDALFHGSGRRIAVKYDNLTGTLHGGNKLRKLEYILARARERGCKRIATFGALGSNHALATAIYAIDAGFDCTCFLSHQAMTPQVSATLRKHLEIGTEIVRFGGGYASRIATLRNHLGGTRTWVVPMGGSSWLGTVGFVDAGLELASQLQAGGTATPGRIYVASGTMGTAAGIALGLALAGIDAEVHAVRVSDTAIMNQQGFDRLMRKTVSMMHRLDASVPADLAERARVRIRHGFFGPGYAKGTEATADAIEFGADQLGLELETTYTGKAMAALLADWDDLPGRGAGVMYWHTYNSVPLEAPPVRALDLNALPAEFLKYLD